MFNQGFNPKPTMARNPVQSQMPDKNPMMASGRPTPNVPMFQPRALPQMASQMGQMASKMKSGMSGMRSGIQSKMQSGMADMASKMKSKMTQTAPQAGMPSPKKPLV